MRPSALMSKDMVGMSFGYQECPLSTRLTITVKKETGWLEYHDLRTQGSYFVKPADSEYIPDLSNERQPIL